MNWKKPLSDQKIGIIGVGNMGQALLSGWMKAQLLAPENVYIHNRTVEKAQEVEKKFSCNRASTHMELVDQSDIILLSTKPQDLHSVLKPLGPHFKPHQLVLSLAAGWDLKTLKTYIPRSFLVRIMLNTPVVVAQGLVAFTPMEPQKDVEKIVEKLFSSMGWVYLLGEKDLAPFTVASSSGTAFVLKIMEHWKSWLHYQGLDEGLAGKIVFQTFLGTLHWAQSCSDIPLAQLIDSVASRKGVTAKGLEVMDQLGLEDLLKISFNRSIARNHELGINPNP